MNATLLQLTAADGTDPGYYLVRVDATGHGNHEKIAGPFRAAEQARWDFERRRLGQQAPFNPSNVHVVRLI